MIKILATGLGAGYLPKAPGTYGSVVGVGLWYLLLQTGAWHTMPMQVLGVILFILFAVWVSGRAEKIFAKHDASEIVIDEIAGILVTFVGIPLHWPSAIAGFVLFRLFDIIKPPPVCQSQRLPGGWGVVIDDVLAGVLANIVLRVALL